MASEKELNYERNSDQVQGPSGDRDDDSNDRGDFPMDEDLADKDRGQGGYDPLGIYFRDIARTPLLTREGELKLAKRIERAERALETCKADPKKVADACLEVKRAKEELVKANLRLVISIANKYTNRGIHLSDLIQEGNIGLMKAVDKFDYRRGTKFSTYAYWWIWQAITRAIQNSAQTIRIPIHQLTLINKMIRASQDLFDVMGREPTHGEIAEKSGFSVDTVKKVLQLANRTHVVSLETPVKDGDAHIQDFIEDPRVISPERAAMEKNVSEGVQMILSTLTPREERILRERFGIGEKSEHTLKEVAGELDLTRERIRQIQEQSLSKLRHPSRRRHLAKFQD